MKALVVVFYLGQSHCSVDRWGRGGLVVAGGKAGSPNAERRKRAILGNDANGISNAKSRSSVVPRTSRAGTDKVECVSNVMYQNVHLIRLIDVSGFLSN